MSMNYFFAAFAPEEIDAMSDDHDLIDQRVFEEDGAMFSTDVESAWDVLRVVLDGAGFDAGEFFDDALTNGGFLLSAGEVREQADRLSRWTREEVAKKLQALPEEADLYHLELYKDEEDMLLEQFDRLADFFRTAAEKGLGAVTYPA